MCGSLYTYIYIYTTYLYVHAGNDCMVSNKSSESTKYQVGVCGGSVDKTVGGRPRRQVGGGGDVGGEVNTMCCVMLCSLSALFMYAAFWECGEGGKCFFEMYLGKDRKDY